MNLRRVRDVDGPGKVGQLHVVIDCHSIANDAALIEVHHVDQQNHGRTVQPYGNMIEKAFRPVPPIPMRESRSEASCKILLPKLKREQSAKCILQNLASEAQKWAKR